jgi:hypothetical protein
MPKARPRAIIITTFNIIIIGYWTVMHNVNANVNRERLRRDALAYVQRSFRSVHYKLMPGRRQQNRIQLTTNLLNDVLNMQIIVA